MFLEIRYGGVGFKEMVKSGVRYGRNNIKKTSIFRSSSEWLGSTLGHSYRILLGRISISIRSTSSGKFMMGSQP